MGYVSVVKDTGITGAAGLDIAYDVTAQASHIFGRLGQGEKTMPGMSAPFRWAAENAKLQSMQISVFPEGGFGFNGGSAIGSEVPFSSAMLIELDITAAAIGYSAGFQAPTASGSVTVTISVDGATALALSAVAAAAALVSLY